jgi:3-keto-disaccharide hydrolase
MRIPWVGLLFAVFVGVAASPGADPPKRKAAEDVTIPVRVFQVSDDDGERKAAVDVRDLQRQVAFMSRAFKPARVQFTFDSTHDLVPLKSTVINRMLGAGDDNWLEAKREGNRIAAGSPGKLVVFLRHGPGPQPAGGSFSWFDYDFIAYSVNAHDYWKLAHEAAHYFGLAHPHGGREFKTLKDAEEYLVEHERQPEIFDGDGRKDTPPCPAIPALYTTIDRSVTLAGHTFTILRGNVVSYYHYPKPEDDLAAGTMTPEQIDRLRWFVETRMKHRMAMPNNTHVSNPIEAASLRVVKADKCEVSPQAMEQFYKGSWSGPRQLFGKGEEGGQVTLELPVPRSGRQRLAAAFTQAPDYGELRFSLDGRPLSVPFNGYAPSVIPSGPIELGDFDLRAGAHECTVTIVGKDAQSTGHSFGLDCLQLSDAKEATTVDDFLKPENWEGLKEIWKIKDGTVTGNTGKGIKSNTFLCGKKNYTDFEMSFQVRLKGAKANSGVQLRSKIIAPEDKFNVSGPQADIADGFWGSLVGENFSPGIMREAPKELVNAKLKKGDFNDYAIRCVGKKVTITVNGAVAVDEEFDNLPEEGIIAFQVHAGGPMEVVFKNIKFRELK